MTSRPYEKGSLRYLFVLLIISSLSLPTNILGDPQAVQVRGSRSPDSDYFIDSPYSGRVCSHSPYSVLRQHSYSVGTHRRTVNRFIAVLWIIIPILVNFLFLADTRIINVICRIPLQPTYNLLVLYQAQPILGVLYLSFKTCKFTAFPRIFVLHLILPLMLTSGYIGMPGTGSQDESFVLAYNVTIDRNHGFNTLNLYNMSGQPGWSSKCGGAIAFNQAFGVISCIGDNPDGGTLLRCSPQLVCTPFAQGVAANVPMSTIVFSLINVFKQAFGFWLDLEGDFLFASSRMSVNNTIVVYSVRTWKKVTTITPPSEGDPTQFGQWVDASGDIALVRMVCFPNSRQPEKHQSPVKTS